MDSTRLWGSIISNDINCNFVPYSEEDNYLLNNAFENKLPDVKISILGATVHFDYEKNLYCQTTPAFKSKPRGFRYVFFGELGEEKTLYYNCFKYKLTIEEPLSNYVVKKFTVTKSENNPIIWQWFNLPQQYICAKGTENNWVNYSQHDSDLIEKAFNEKSNVMLNIGITPYLITPDENGYGIQKNNTNHYERSIRRARNKNNFKEIPVNLNDESCGICLELFTDTKHLPIKTTKCGHNFHDTCLISCMARSGHRCPLCRADL